MGKRTYRKVKIRPPVTAIDTNDERIETAWFLFDQTTASRSRLKPGVAAVFHGILSLLAREWDAVAAAYTTTNIDTALRINGQRQYARNVASGLRNAKARMIESFPTYELISAQETAEEEISALIAKRKRRPKTDPETVTSHPESEVA